MILKLAIEISLEDNKNSCKNESKLAYEHDKFQFLNPLPSLAMYETKQSLTWVFGLHVLPYEIKACVLHVAICKFRTTLTNYEILLNSCSRRLFIVISNPVCIRAYLIFTFLFFFSSLKHKTLSIKYFTKSAYARWPTLVILDRSKTVLLCSISAYYIRSDCCRWRIRKKEQKPHHKRNIFLGLHVCGHGVILA